MDARARFLCTMRFKPVDRLPIWEWHFYDQTIERK